MQQRVAFIVARAPRGRRLRARRRRGPHRPRRHRPGHPRPRLLRYPSRRVQEVLPHVSEALERAGLSVTVERSSAGRRRLAHRPGRRRPERGRRSRAPRQHSPRQPGRVGRCRGGDSGPARARAHAHDQVSILIVGTARSACGLGSCTAIEPTCDRSPSRPGVRATSVDLGARAGRTTASTTTTTRTGGRRSSTWCHRWSQGLKALAAGARPQYCSLGSPHWLTRLRPEDPQRTRAPSLQSGRSSTLTAGDLCVSSTQRWIKRGGLACAV